MRTRNATSGPVLSTIVKVSVDPGVIAPGASASQAITSPVVLHPGDLVRSVMHGAPPGFPSGLIVVCAVDTSFSPPKIAFVFSTLVGCPAGALDFRVEVMSKRFVP